MPFPVIHVQVCLILVGQPCIHFVTCHTLGICTLPLVLVLCSAPSVLCLLAGHGSEQADTPPPPPHELSISPNTTPTHSPSSPVLHTGDMGPAASLQEGKGPLCLFTASADHSVTLQQLLYVITLCCGNSGTLWKYYRIRCPVLRHVFP